MPKTLKRNDPCHCGSGSKYKKCCMRRDAKRPVIKGTFDPDLPIAEDAGAVGNHRGGDGHWYVIRSGWGHKKTPPLEGERLDQAGRMIADWEKRRQERLRSNGGAFGATLAAAALWAGIG
jgi:hypothetical protein